MFCLGVMTGRLQKGEIMEAEEIQRAVKDDGGVVQERGKVCSKSESKDGRHSHKFQRDTV